MENVFQLDAWVPLKAVLMLYFCRGLFPTGHCDEVGVPLPLLFFFSPRTGTKKEVRESVERTVWRLSSFTPSEPLMGNENPTSSYEGMFSKATAGIQFIR